MENHAKFLLLTLSAGLCLAPVLRAEEAPSPAPAAPAEAPRHERGDRRQKMREHMIQALALTAEQQAKWAEIDQQQKTALEKVAPEDRRAKGREIRQKGNAQRRAVLTPEQQTKFDEILAKQKQRRKEQGEGPAGPPPPPPPPESN